MRDKMRHINVILIIILLLTTLSGCIEINPDEDIKTITALEGKEKADKIANEWNEDSILVLVGSVGKGDDSGGRTAWYYSYYSRPSTKVVDNVTKHQHVNIRVNSENEVSKEEFWSRKGEDITNWTVDSDQAVEIAKQEPEIESYLDEYDDASLGMTLKMWDNLPNGEKNPNQDSATWSIGWEDMGGFDDPKHARVFVDAESGEVLYVEADE